MTEHTYMYMNLDVCNNQYTYIVHVCTHIHVHIQGYTEDGGRIAEPQHGRQVPGQGLGQVRHSQG